MNQKRCDLPNARMYDQRFYAKRLLTLFSQSCRCRDPIAQRIARTIDGRRNEILAFHTSNRAFTAVNPITEKIRRIDDWYRRVTNMPDADHSTAVVSHGLVCQHAVSESAHQPLRRRAPKSCFPCPANGADGG